MMGLYVEHLTVGYGKRRILTDVNLSIRPGEIVALLGANGSGKTTLLRTIGGSIAPISGRMMIDDVDLSELSVRRRASLVTTMSQEFAAETGLTGWDRIEMSFFPVKGLFDRLTEKERASIGAMADEFGMRTLLDRDLSAMSAGERQMVSLLAAAVRQTPVLLLDEPASALDFNRSEEMFALLHRLAEQGRAILVVLHDPTQALRHATGICCVDGDQLRRLDLMALSDGELEATLRQLYPHLKIHRDPLFCYADASLRKDINDADH